MKSLLSLWNQIAHECAMRCCTSATMDCKTVQGRVEHEGLSFLTITLPEFGKDLQKGLDRGWVAPDLFTGFRWQAGLPVFLRGFLERVFHANGGVLLDEPCIDSILCLRQLTLMFGKILLPSSDTRVRRAMRDYVECEQDVRRADRERSSSNVEDFRRVSALLFGHLFTDVDRDIYYLDEAVPKHGPGATADGLRANAKYQQKTWTVRLEEIFPSGEFLLPNWSFYDQLDEIDILEPGSEIPVKVIPVPKTLKTPRIIAVEPTAMQYAQQAILPLIVDGIQRHDTLGSIIGFDDQSPNQRMAEEGSLLGELATLDLSEASDRVSNQLVREMLRNWPHLSKAVDASRSRKADVPGEGVIRLAKFASMGSALCFPFEAMVFTTLVFMGIEKGLSTSLDRRIVKQFARQVRIYGDDVIIPVDHVQPVVHMLQAFGLVVNMDKSFWTGKFRESCGKEYYDGHDVSIVKVRRTFPTQREDAAGVISIVSLRNQLYWAGYWRTCKWLDDYIRGIIKYFPVVLPSSPVLGRHSALGFETQRVGDRLHNPQVKGYVVAARIPPSPLEGSGALLKYFLKRGNLPVVDRNHLERSGRPQAVNLKLRWASAI